MSLLASLNPEDAGARSDDDFVIGQVTFGGTAQLRAATVQLAWWELRSTCSFGLLGHRSVRVVRPRSGSA